MQFDDDQDPFASDPSYEQDLGGAPDPFEPAASSSPQSQPDPIYDPFTPVSAPSGAPDHRVYVMPRQPPSFQHASLAGTDPSSRPLATLAAGVLQVLAGAGAGYLVTGSVKKAAGVGLTVLGAGQLPHIFSEDWAKRIGISAASLAGAYFLLRGSPGLQAVENRASHWLRAQD